MGVLYRKSVFIWKGIMSNQETYFFAPFDNDKETINWMNENGYTEDRYVTVLSESGKVIRNAIEVTASMIKEIATSLKVGTCCYYYGSPKVVHPISTDDYIKIIT